MLTPKSLSVCKIGPAVDLAFKKVFSVNSISKYSGSKPEPAKAEDAGSEKEFEEFEKEMSA